MTSSSEKTRASAAQVRDHFRRNASAFDSLYDEDGFLQRRARPGLGRRRAVALEAVDAYPSPRVLDVGCGSGRVAEHVLEHGASRYVGIDFSEPMLALAAERLERFGSKVELVQGDFLETPLDGPFEVVLALGLFDYLPEPAPFVARMRELCSGSLVASFPGWNWFKGPIRKVRYELVNRVPIFDYTEPGLRQLLAEHGFTRVEIVRPGKSGYVVRAQP
jgi:SAM-dependent methyltransferase